MISITDSSPVRHNESYTITPTSRIRGGPETSTMTTMPAALKHPHDNSIASFSQDFPLHVLNPEQNFEKFATTLLKNKALLVPTRLALKRQRASLKPPNTTFQPNHSDILQMELGNPEELRLNNNSNDGEHTTLVSNNTNLSSEQNRMQSTSNRTSPLRGDTPHTAPTDISLLYREKPSFSHPITGNFIVQYAEENGSPSPCSYVLPRKSCREKNAPAYSFGSRCSVEKKGGSRTGWQKQWFAHSNPYTTKVDFNREVVWPTPFHYPPKTTIGTQPTKHSFPSWSMAARLQTNPNIAPENNPSPDTYDTISAFHKLTATNTHITIKSRPGGTRVSTNKTTDRIPGPGAYDNKHFLSNKSSAPKHSFGKRFPTSYAQDPYVNTIPSIKT